jgi:peptide/nickel transport system substrate-binding protein
MNKKYLKAVITPLTITILLVAVCLSSISQVCAVEIPRDQIVWGSGYYPHPVTFRPYLIDSGEGWDTYIMYEPMFGTNVVTGELIKWLGQDISWLNSTCIKVTLRQGIKWSDGSPITSYDVRYTYLLLGAFTESPSWAYYMGGFRTRVGSMSNFEIVDNRTFNVHINPAYANSSVVWRQMTQSFVIMPEKVWTDVNATEVAANKTLQAFANDWLDSATPAKWKVASGMYLPYWHDDVRTIMKRNENWWGISVFGKEPAPPYLGYITYDTNPPAALALQAGELDWCGKYIPGIGDMMAANPNIHTYFSNPPYFPDKSALLLVPNHRKYPLNEPWLHKAITAVMDYDAFSTVCSGYLKKPNVLLLPADDAVARQLLNTTILEKYSIPYNVTYALALLNQYCIKVNGQWYTKEGPSADYLALYNETMADYPDALPNTPGVNIPLGPWTIIDISGWTDVNAIDVFAADAVSSLLGISLSTQFIDFGTYVSKMDANNYDFADYCMHWGIDGDLYQRYTQLFTGAYEGAWNHYGSYRNATLNTLLDLLDTAPSGSQAQQNIANKIEEIVGQDVPIIPLGGHPDWYIYYDKYWVGWPNALTNPFLPASPFGGSTQDANLHALLLGLKAQATLVYSNIVVSKANVVPRENTTISVNAKNTRGMAAVSTVELLVNGTIVNSKEVTFAINETKTVSFSVSEQNLGTYQAAIGGLTTSFIVTAAPVVPATISGNVTDAQTGKPISGATVTAGAYSTTTGTNGSYLLQVATGTYSLAVIMAGYVSNVTSVNAAVKGTTYTINIALAPVSTAIPTWVYGVIVVLVIIAVVALAYALVFKKKKK